MTSEERQRLQSLLESQGVMLQRGRQLIERALAWLAQVENIRRLLLERLKEEP